MKISSPYKDYYDYVAGQYGGGDPNVLYVRTRLAPLQQMPGGGLVQSDIDLDATDVKNLPPLPTYEWANRFDHTAPKRDTKWLVIAGKMYLIVQEGTNTWHVLDQELHPIMWNTLFGKNAGRCYTPWGYQQRTLGMYIGKESEAAIKLSRKLNAPVFTLFTQGYRQYAVDGTIPVLAQCGIPSIIPAEQMYQNIAYFVGNTMHDQPDAPPPGKQTDKEKIIAHGLDYVKSFRHRT